MASIYSSLTPLLFAERYSDLTITCRGRTFLAHRAVVCSQSAFFARACDGGFEESLTHNIDLPEDDPDILDRFLQFLYTGNYEDGEYPTLGRPSAPAILTPERVQEELRHAPGIEVQDDAADPGEASETPTQYHNPGGRQETDEDDDDYAPSHVEESREQSEIEYNEFDEDDHGEPYAGHGYRYDVPHSLYTSLRVYVMADKFDVPALKLLARDRFYRTAEAVFSRNTLPQLSPRFMMSEDLPKVVDELYRSLPPSDIAMREIPCRLIANNYWDTEIRTSILPVMRAHGDLAVGVLHYMWERNLVAMDG